MRVIKDICYADTESEDIRITDAEIQAGGILLVSFNNGEKRLFDTSGLKGPVFDPLKDQNILKNFTVFHGFLLWKDQDIDIAPETVYLEGNPYE